jgi:hypothetical protein
MNTRVASSPLVLTAASATFPGSCFLLFRRFNPLPQFLFFTAVLPAVLSATLIDLSFKINASDNGDPFSYTVGFTYDTLLNTSTQFYSAGGEFPNGDKAGHYMLGYSASGIVATSIVIEGRTIGVEDLKYITLAPGIMEDFYLDTDIEYTTPSRSAIYFGGVNYYLQLGTVGTSLGWVEFDNLSGFVDVEAGIDSLGYATITRSVRSTTVPDAGATAGLFAGALLLMGVARGRLIH